MWLYFRFTLSFRDVEEMLAQRFLTTHAGVYNTLYIQRHLISRPTLRRFRAEADEAWAAATA